MSRLKKPIVAISAVLLIAGLLFALKSALGVTTEGRGAQVASLSSIPAPVRDFNWTGTVNYHIFEGYRGNTYWLAGESPTEEVERFAKGHQLQLDDQPINFKATVFGLNPDDFKIDGRFAYVAHGYCEGLGDVTIYHLRQEGRTIFHVVQNKP